ncbi:hypothetical protein NDU88_000102 [Pleurodeles waltl]|uniref:IF rod domain-containing protein n=1 Tax=Pleurodeles waltl TaxID=8319 RepID=A0AAV7V624_PLEWA|nr:hypothetical protein NDU88_000102 [Pleurodeles waltl]
MSWNYGCAELLGLPGLWGSLVMGILTSKSLGTTAGRSCLAFLGYGAPCLWGSWVMGAPGLWGSLLADLLELQLLGAASPSWLTFTLKIVVIIVENRLAVGEQSSSQAKKWISENVWGEIRTNLENATGTAEEQGEHAIRITKNNIQELEEALKRAMQNMADKVCDYQEAANMKMSLDIEIATLCILLEEE